MNPAVFWKPSRGTGEGVFVFTLEGSCNSQINFDRIQNVVPAFCCCCYCEMIKFQWTCKKRTKSSSQPAIKCHQLCLDQLLSNPPQYTMYRSDHNIIPLKSGSAKNIYNVYNVGIQWRYTMYIYSVYNVYNVQIQPQHYPTKIRVCEDTFPRFPYSTYPAPLPLSTCFIQTLMIISRRKKYFWHEKQDMKSTKYLT